MPVEARLAPLKLGSFRISQRKVGDPMKNLVLFVLAVALLASIPCEVYAGPAGLFPNFHPLQKVGQVARRAGRVAKKAVAAPVKLAARRARARRGNSSGACGG